MTDIQTSLDQYIDLAILKESDALYEHTFYENQPTMLQQINECESGVIGFIGDHGTGKSTFLNEVRKIDENNYWIQFDARKYPDRKELWEYFVIELCLKLDSNMSINKLELILDGKGSNRKKALTSLVAKYAGKGLGELAEGRLSDFSIGNALCSLDQNFRNIFNESIEEHKDDVGAITKDIAKDATEIYAKTDFASSSMRYYMYLNLVKGIITSSKKLKDDKGLIIVIEDIDRSREDGLIFLETLSYFVRTFNDRLKDDLKRKIICICPISPKSYDNTDTNPIYVKCFDYLLEFEKDRAFEMFTNAFFKGVDHCFLKKFSETLSILGGNHNIREIKAILRNSSSKIKKLLKLLYQNNARIYEEELTSKLISIYIILYLTEYIKMGDGEARRSTPKSSLYASIKTTKILRKVERGYRIGDSILSGYSYILGPVFEYIASVFSVGQQFPDAIIFTNENSAMHFKVNDQINTSTYERTLLLPEYLLI